MLAYHLSEAASNLVIHVSTLAQHLQQAQLNASRELDKHIRATLIANTTSKAESDINRVLNASARTFVSLFHGLETLWAIGTELAQRHHGAVTFSYIQAVNTLLSAVTSTCNLIAEQELALALTESSSSAPAVRLKQSRAPKKPIDTHIPKVLATFIRMLLTQLTPVRGGAHAALFEGILYYLLEATGKRLFAVTFDHERSEIVEGDINPSPLTAVKTKAVRIEVKLLVGLLDQAMSLVPNFLGSLATPAPPKKKGVAKAVRPGTSSNVSLRMSSAARPGTSSTRANTKGFSQPKATMSISAKEKLQATLIHCMFGDEIRDSLEDLDSDDDTQDEGVELTRAAKNGFMDRLRKPVAMGPIVQPPKMEESDVPQWFREEIWRIVGWDLLGRVSEW
jgi:hypothetical protein